MLCGGAGCTLPSRLTSTADARPLCCLLQPSPQLSLRVLPLAVQQQPPPHLLPFQASAAVAVCLLPLVLPLLVPPMPSCRVWLLLRVRMRKAAADVQWQRCCRHSC